MSDVFQSFEGARRAKLDKESPELKAQRIVANLLTLHVAKRQTVGLDAPLDDKDKARLKLALTIFRGPHGESVRYLFQQAFPEWKGAQLPESEVVTSGD